MTAAVRLRFASLVSAWVFVPMIPLQVFGYFDRGRPWRGEWLWTMDWAGTILFIPGALVAMACAIDAGRMMGRRRSWLVDTSPSQWKAVASIGLPCLLTVGSVHLLTIAAYAAATAAAGSVAPPAAVLSMLGVQLAGLALFVTLGVVAGSLLGPGFGPVAAAVVVMTTSYGAGEGFAPVVFGTATVSLVGFELSDEYYALQLSVLASLVVLGILVRTRQTAAGARVPTMAGTMAVGLAVALFLGSQSFGPEQRFVLDDAARPDACVGEHVLICFFPEHRPIAESIVDDVEALYLVAAERGVADLLPARVAETVQGIGDLDGSAGLTLSPDEVESREITTIRLVEEILTPEHCPQLHAETPPEDPYWLSLEELMIYLTSLESYVVDGVGFSSLDDYRAYADQTGGGLAVPGTPPRELTRAQARQALERLWACDF